MDTNARSKRNGLLRFIFDLETLFFTAVVGFAITVLLLTGFDMRGPSPPKKDLWFDIIKPAIAGRSPP